jgi:four helix bundle protein
MLDIYKVSLEIVTMLVPVISKIESRDKNVAGQLGRCSKSAPANIAEGCAHRGASRRHKYEIALGEARETATWLDIAEAAGLAKRPEGIDARLNHVIGTLVKLTR